MDGLLPTWMFLSLFPPLFPLFLKINEKCPQGGITTTKDTSAEAHPQPEGVKARPPILSCCHSSVARPEAGPAGQGFAVSQSAGLLQTEASDSMQSALGLKRPQGVADAAEDRAPRSTGPGLPTHDALTPSALHRPSCMHGCPMCGGQRADLEFVLLLHETRLIGYTTKSSDAWDTGAAGSPDGGCLEPRSVQA